MAIIIADVWEVIFFVEKVNSNFHSLNISESLTLAEIVNDKIKIANVSEKLNLIERPKLQRTIINLNISDRLSFSELVAPKVFFLDVGDVLSLSEKLNNEFFEQLNLVETLEVDVSIVASDELDLVEDLELNVNTSQLISDELDILESLNYVITQTSQPILKYTVDPTDGRTLIPVFGNFFRPGQFGPVTNTRAIQFTYNKFGIFSTLILPPPDFGNIERYNYTRVNKRSRGGDLIIFRASYWPRTITFSYKWSYLKDVQIQEALNFLRNVLGNVISMTDWEGRNFNGIIVNPDAQAVDTSIQTNEFAIDFECQ